MISYHPFKHSLDLSNYHLIGLFTQINFKDGFLQENYPAVLNQETLNQLIEHGLGSKKEARCFHVHPLLNFQLKKELVPKKNIEQVLLKYYQIFLDKAKFVQPKLQVQNQRARKQIMAAIQVDLLNYYWVGLKTALTTHRFIEVFKTLTDYWIYLAEYEEVIAYAQKIITKFETINLNQLTVIHQLVFLKVKEIKGYAFYSQGKYKEAESIYLMILKEYYNWKLTEENELILGRIYQNLGIIYRNLKDYHQGKLYLKKALKIFRAYKEQVSEASVMQNYANLLLTTNQFQEALNGYLDALPVFEHINEVYSQAEIFQNMGLCYRKLKQFDRSRAYYYKALSIYTAFNDQKGQAQIYQNLGVLSWDTQSYQVAIDYYKKAIQLYIPLNAYHQQGKIYQNLGVAYKNLNEFEDSITYYKKAATLYRSIKDEQTYGRVLFNMGVVKWKQKLYPESEQYFKEAASIFETFNDYNQLGNVYLNLGVLYGHWGKEEKSQAFSIKALKVLKENNNHAHAARAALHLGITLNSEKKYEESNGLFKEGLSMAKLANDSFMAGVICKNMTKNFMQLNRLDIAVDYLVIAWKALLKFSNNKHLLEIKELAEKLFELTGNSKLMLIIQR